MLKQKFILFVAFMLFPALCFSNETNKTTATDKTEKTSDDAVKSRSPLDGLNLLGGDSNEWSIIPKGFKYVPDKNCFVLHSGVKAILGDVTLYSDSAVAFPSSDDNSSGNLLFGNANFSRIVALSNVVVVSKEHKITGDKATFHVNEEKIVVEGNALYQNIVDNTKTAADIFEYDMKQKSLVLRGEKPTVIKIKMNSNLQNSLR